MSFSPQPFNPYPYVVADNPDNPNAQMWRRIGDGLAELLRNSSMGNSPGDPFFRYGVANAQIQPLPNFGVSGAFGTGAMPGPQIPAFPVPTLPTPTLPASFYAGGTGVPHSQKDANTTAGGKGTSTTPARPGAESFGANPNEPAPGMANQYNQGALNNQPVTNNGAGGQTVGQGKGAGGSGYRTWIDQQGNKRSDNKNIDFAYLNIDRAVGAGFTDQFMQLHGMDPISFYSRAFLNDPKAKGFELPGPQGDQARSWLFFKSAQAAENDARFLPGAIAEWQRVHGNAEIPQEQWDRWWGISQATGGYPMNVGVGENPYGVH